MTDRMRQMTEATKTLGVPAMITAALLYWIVVPITTDYRDVVKKTVEIQGKTAATMERIADVQVSQTRTLEELAKLTQRSVDCLQRVEASLRDIERRSGQPVSSKGESP